jgi:hypothetical protein
MQPTTPHVQKLASIEHYIMQQQPYNNFLPKNKVFRILITKGIGEYWSYYVQKLFLELLFRLV